MEEVRVPRCALNTGWSQCGTCESGNASLWVWTLQGFSARLRVWPEDCACVDKGEYRVWSGLRLCGEVMG